MTKVEVGAFAAIFSENRRYRFFLRRRVSFGRTWGYGWLMVCNLSPLRATHSADLKAAGPEPAPVWETNIPAILPTAGRKERHKDGHD